jgi:hypothetical protein
MAGSTGFEFLLAIIGEMQAYDEKVHDDRFQEAFKAFKDYKVLPGVRSDGNCAPDSLALGLFWDDPTTQARTLPKVRVVARSREIRVSIGKFLKLNQNTIVIPGVTFNDLAFSENVPRSSWIEFCDNLSTDKTWVGLEFWAAAAHVFKKPMKLVTGVVGLPVLHYVPPGGTIDMPPTFMFINQKSQHYEVIVKGDNDKDDNKDDSTKDGNGATGDDKDGNGHGKDDDNDNDDDKDNDDNDKIKDVNTGHDGKETSHRSSYPIPSSLLDVATDEVVAGNSNNEVVDGEHAREHKDNDDNDKDNDDNDNVKDVNNGHNDEETSHRSSHPILSSLLDVATDEVVTGNSNNNANDNDANDKNNDANDKVKDDNNGHEDKKTSPSGGNATTEDKSGNSNSSNDVVEEWEADVGPAQHTNTHTHARVHTHTHPNAHTPRLRPRCRIGIIHARSTNRQFSF